MGWQTRHRLWFLVTVAVLFLAVETPLLGFSYRFLQIMESSRGAQGISGPMGLTERVLYSFLLADAER